MKRKLPQLLFLVLILANATAASNIIVSKSSSDPSPAQAGSDLFLTVLLQNYVIAGGAYGTSINNVKAELETSPPFSLKVERERVTEIESLCDNCFKELDYHLYVDSSAKSGTYPLKLKVTYNDGSSPRGLESNVMIEVRNYKHTVGISDVSVSKTPLLPGDRADLALTIKNYGVEDIRQAEVTLTAPLKINIIGSTKRFFLEGLGSGKSFTMNYPMAVDSKAEMGAYEFPLSIKVTDNYGNEQTFMDNIGVQVYAQPDIQFSVRSYDVSTGKISTLVANRGKATASYTMVRISGVKATPSEVYIGNLDSDDYSTADFTVEPQAGTAVLTVDYIDSNNAERTATQTVDVRMPPQSNGTSFILGGAVLIVAGLVYWFFLRKPAKTK